MGQCAKCSGWIPDNVNFGYRHQVCPECQRQDAYINAMQSEAKRAAKRAAKEERKEQANRVRAVKRAQALAEAKQTNKETDEAIRKFWKSIRLGIRRSFFGSRLGGLCGLVLVYFISKLTINYFTSLASAGEPLKISFLSAIPYFFLGTFLLFLVAQFAWVCFVSVIVGRKKT
jgi:hypothetical protein